MTLERILGGACDPPFPVYAHLADDLGGRTPRRQWRARCDGRARARDVCGVRLFGRRYRRHDDDQAWPRCQRLRTHHPDGRRHVHLLDRLSGAKPLWPGGDPVLSRDRACDARQLAWRCRGRFRVEHDVAGRRRTGVQSPCRIPPKRPCDVVDGAAGIDARASGKVARPSRRDRRVSTRSPVCDGPQPWRRDGGAVRAETRRSA